MWSEVTGVGVRLEEGRKGCGCWQEVGACAVGGVPLKASQPTPLIITSNYIGAAWVSVCRVLPPIVLSFHALLDNTRIKLQSPPPPVLTKINIQEHSHEGFPKSATIPSS